MEGLVLFYVIFIIFFFTWEVPTMPAAQRRLIARWVIPAAVNVSALTASPTNVSTNMRYSAPQGRGSNLASMQITATRVCFYLFLSLSLVMQQPGHSVPLDHTGSITHLCYYDPRTVMRNVSGRQSISKFSLSCFALQGSPSILS